MADLDVVLRGGTLVRPGAAPFLADVGIKDGRIAIVAEPGTDLEAVSTLDIGGLHIFPGAVDPHVHVGLGGGLEEYATDTAAAVLGGTTTIYSILIDNRPYLPLVEEHQAAASRDSMTDFGFHVTLMSDDHLSELGELATRHGIRSYKYYMSFRGDEGAYLGVEGTDDGAFLGILEAVAAQDGVLAVHPENIEIVWRLRERVRASGADDLAAWNHSRPPMVEAEAIGRAAFLADQTNTTVYFVHVSSELPLEEGRRARARYGDKIVVETCPHYLTHTDDSEVGILGKVNPPLRGRSDVEAMWAGVADGTVDTIGSDHVGRRRDKKVGSIWTASAGFPGMPTVLPVMISEGYHTRGIPLGRIAEMTALNPARIFGSDDHKGDIRPGLDADLAVVDLEWERLPDAASLGTWSDYSLYEDRPLKGWPRFTFVRGRLVQQDGALTAEPGDARQVRARG